MTLVKDTQGGEPALQRFVGILGLDKEMLRGVTCSDPFAKFHPVGTDAQSGASTGGRLVAHRE